ncbi:hypothetical protein [Photobacterium leiognathi]|uniref:Alpha/beta hydrolase n=1 Tax=Photobacterium leiognathi TaxID=553611 RepID=A0A2T3M7I4_PHOLE|nr:hypothetical protein [Photobacterium leiognathi]KJF97106.1 hypothetical protein UB34_14715 [Photobacterium leiognathi]PSV88129.1 hypothetical protein CTM89_15225 [Photobacterium leiognathi]
MSKSSLLKGFYPSIKVLFIPFFLFFVLSGTANASWLGGEKLNGKHVVLVHGFQFSDLKKAPREDEYLERCPVSYGFRKLASYCVGWPSHLTFKELKPILAHHVNRIKKLLGDQKIVFITHSSGDLIKEYILKYQKSWLRSQGKSPLNIEMSIDFSGGSGGTELADLAALFKSDWLVNLLLGHNNGLGFLTELTTSKARSLTNSSSRYSSIPRIRIVSTGKQNWYTGVLIFFKILKGDADDLIPLHSQCGGKYARKMSSCDLWIAMDGRRQKQSTGMRIADRRDNFYPWLGSRIATHNKILSDRNLSADELVKFGLVPNYDRLSETYKTTGFWFWEKRYRFVSGTKGLTMADILSKLR